MVLLDTNIFVIDRFFPRDTRHIINKEFVARLTELEAGFSIFSLFELCGMASFNLSPNELKRWSYQFDEVYHVQILEPKKLDSSLAISWFGHFTHQVFEMLERKMTWGDAVLLHAAEEHGVEVIVTWNEKHFVGRSQVAVLTPQGYLSNYG